MIQINLLPWREQSRKIKKKRLIAGCILSVVFAFFVLVASHLYLSHFINEQYYVNTTLQQEVNNEQMAVASTNSDQKKKLELENRLKIIADLHDRSYDTIRFLNEIATIIPESVSLNKILLSGKNIELGGYATTDSDITQLLEIIKKSPLINNATLNQITSGSDKNEGKRFFLIVAEQKD